MSGYSKEAQVQFIRTCLILLVIAFGFYFAVYLNTIYFEGGGNPHLFFHPDNLANLLGQASIVGILACGMSLVIISGNIDLSVGSLLGMLGAVGAWLQLSEGYFAFNGWVVILCVVFIGALLGTLQGSLVGKLSLPAFIVTLGGLMVFRGVLLLLAKSTIPIQSPVVIALGTAVLPKGVTYIFSGFILLCLIPILKSRVNTNHLWHTICGVVLCLLGTASLVWINQGEGLPLRFAIMIGLGMAFHIISTRFTFGRYLFAIGGNRQAAYYAGIPVERYIIGVFAVMGGVAGIAGLVSSGIQMAAEAGAGDLMELYAVAACVIGGCSLSGGKGSVSGSIIGALIMATIRNGLSCLGIGNPGEKIVLGVILILAVASDRRLSQSKKL